VSTRIPTTWSDVRLVAGREISEKLHSRSFLVSNLLFLALVAASIALPALVFDDSPPDFDVAVVGSQAAALVEAAPTDQVDLTARAVEDAAAADRLLRDEEVDAAVEVRGGQLLVTALQEAPSSLVQALAGTAQVAELQTALAESGASPGEVARLLAPVEVEQRLLEDTGLDPAVVPLLSVAFALLFFFVVFQYGYAIAQGVVQEKESRIVELLVTAVSVRTLLFGKVLGNGGLALAQIASLVLVAAAGAAATGEQELLGLLARNAGWFVLFFGLGFLLLSCLWAATGAFASRSDDLQSTTAPVQLLLIAPFLAAVYVGEGTVRTALSYVPFTAPLVMPARMLSGDAEPWEAGVSALLLLLAAGAAVLLGERLYRSSLLRTRGRTSLADAWSGRVSAGS
jgi:ABC-2 type transport system permease protein